MSADSLTGKKLGKYEIGPLIGQGGMAQVYKGRHPALNRDVAVKLIHPHLANREGFVERFQREAQLVAALRHPNIVQVFDFDSQADVYYMVMEFIDGPTLAAHLEELREKGQLLPFDQVLNLVITLCHALSYAHALGMVHRDLKPGNVMFTRKGQPVLTDFGLAKIVGGITNTSSGLVIGTPMYMSPEQGYGRGSDSRSDIYALGVMLFELVTGQLPFEGDTPISIVLKQINQPLPSAWQINPRLPNEIDLVIAKATAKSSQERYQTCDGFATALEALRLPNIHRTGEMPASPVVTNATPPAFTPPVITPPSITPPPLPERQTVTLDGLSNVFIQVLGPVGRIMEVDRFVRSMRERRDAFPADRLDELLDRVAAYYRITDSEKRRQIREGAHALPMSNSVRSDNR